MSEYFKQWPLTKRAGRACLNCRARKVKCNVDENGPPCRNCLTGDVACRVQKSKRGRKPGKLSQYCPSNAQKTSPSDVVMLDADTSAIGSSRRLVAARHTTGWLPSYDSKNEATSPPDKSASPGQESDMLSRLFGSSIPNLDQDHLHLELSYASLIDPDTMHYTTHFGPHSPGNGSTSHPSPSVQSMETNLYNMPDYVKPLSPHLTPDDMNYLYTKGALEIPPISFRDALIRCHIQYVHPFLPLLDLPSLVYRTIVPGRIETPQISILLLQAVMFAAMAFVDIDEIHKAGFKTRRSARKIFYERIRLLYDLDVESDRVTIIQAALLMSYWNETPGDNKGGWHWMGIAVSLALTLGMHRKTEYTVISRETRLYKRIWWACYIRDRMLALGMSRPLRIKDHEFDTPMLTLGDFEIDDFATEHVDPFLSPNSQTALAEICIEMAQLCVHLGVVVDLHFSLLAAGHSALNPADKTGRTNIMLFPRSIPCPSDSLQICDDALQKWAHNRRSARIYNSPGPEDVASSPWIIVQRAFLDITFESIVSALHRPQIRPHPQWTNEESRKMSVKRIEEASIGIAKTVRDLHQFHLDGYLPPTAATMQLPAMITHMKRLQTQENRGAQEYLDSLFCCLKVLEKLQELYVGADLCMFFAMELLKGANITPAVGSDLKLSQIVYRGSRSDLSLFHSSSVEIPLARTATTATARVDMVSRKDGYQDISNLESDYMPPFIGDDTDAGVLSNGLPTDGNYNGQMSTPNEADLEDFFGTLIGFDDLLEGETGWPNYLNDMEILVP
ncbi:uncharacterized protein Z518_04745 [Rhinocladiella mackenziei CBS 650.93]|uniref:Zn(2)-C6 fungal-type domain-containing protein n=1 Tax=Rhinocladiella mackenziei CBS 650.93 TaxID=1442369 RepID=A0A0D2ILX6_9EURO|nr:uncharacterized protein Z518_04745 [Rhinocladiella mackenziei CBS 650.93]KIX06769.1 hypothetical protein Z518_04745 [Rhinocladiella mackenziei CBS 650.93]